MVERRAAPENAGTGPALSVKLQRANFLRAVEDPEHEQQAAVKAEEIEPERHITAGQRVCMASGFTLPKLAAKCTAAIQHQPSTCSGFLHPIRSHRRHPLAEQKSLPLHRVLAAADSPQAASSELRWTGFGCRFGQVAQPAASHRELRRPTAR